MQLRLESLTPSTQHRNLTCLQHVSSVKDSSPTEAGTQVQKDRSIDGTGKVIGDPDADWVDRDPQSRTYGKIMTGLEYFSIFSGRTGTEMATLPYVPGREPTGGWGGIGGNGGAETVRAGMKLCTPSSE